MLSRGAPAVEKSVMASGPMWEAAWVKGGESFKDNMPLNERLHQRPEDYGREHFVVDNG